MGARCIRLLAVATLLAVVAWGAARMADIAAEFAVTYPSASATAGLLFAVLGIPIWLPVHRLDYFDRRSPVAFALAFAWGGLVATAVSIPASAAAEDILAKLMGPAFAADWGAALAAPTVEEVAKAAGIVALTLIVRKRFASVLDGIVIGGLVGLGFQIVEDIVFAVSAVSMAGGGDQVRPVFDTFLFRGVLAGALSHALFSALTGIGIAYFVVRRDRPLHTRSAVFAVAALGAWASHVLWNLPFPDSLDHGYLLPDLALKALPSLVLLIFLARRAHDVEADYCASALAALDDDSLASSDEADTLRSGSQRARARRTARRLAGGRGRRAMRAMQRSQAALAVRLGRDGLSYSADLQRLVIEIRTRRAVLHELGLAGPVPPTVVLTALPAGAAAPVRPATRILDFAVSVLPPDDRERYAEEFWAELFDLAQRRARLLVQVAYTGHQLLAAAALRRELLRAEPGEDEP
jgi:protease PrsW